MEIVKLSSYFPKIFRAFLLLTILLNISGILFIKLLIPEDKAVSYDLALNYSLIAISLFTLVLSFNLPDIEFDKTNKIIILRYLWKKELINSRDVLAVEKVFPSKCKIIYKSKRSKKKVLFIPRISAHILLSDYLDHFEPLLKDSNHLRRK